MLERLGQRPVVVANGEEALAAVHAAPYDLVLMDVHMPVMDGHEATRRIRAELPAERQPRIVAMTAGALVEDIDATFASGMDDHLSKPVRSEELAAALARVRTRPEGAASGAAADEANLRPCSTRTVLETLVGHLGAGADAFRQRLVDAWVTDSGQQPGPARRRRDRLRRRRRGRHRAQHALGERGPRRAAGRPPVGGARPWPATVPTRRGWPSLATAASAEVRRARDALSD